MRTVGTTSRGVRCPVVREGDDLVKIVTDAILACGEEQGLTFHDRDIVAVTEAVVARSQGNYAGVEDIAADCRAKFGADTVALTFPILSRNRIAICLKGIAKAFKKVYILMSYPSDEVGNHLFDEDLLDEKGVNPWSDVLDEAKYRELFGYEKHPFTGVDYVEYYGDLFRAEGCEPVFLFGNDVRAVLPYTKNVLCCDIHTRERSKRLLKKAGAELVLGLDELMTASGYVDLLIPRGGAGLIRACVDNATVPVIETGTGICHVYVDRAADLDMALDILENAKCSRPSVCNAAEVCLVHREAAPVFLPRMRERLTDARAARGERPVELRLDGTAAGIIPGTPAGPEDFDTEFLDYILAVRVVDGTEEAIRHIAAPSTGHSEAIVTEDGEAARRFLAAVDSAAVYWNASTRFTDGGEFGLGCEMGISTQKLHARGPLGLAELCSFKFVIRGGGQIR